MNNNAVVNSYENYHEENRFTEDNAHKVEFITTIKILENFISKKSKILDCAAGTGAYSFYLAEKGHDVTALDITPRHIEYIKNGLKNRPYFINAFVNDARSLKQFDDESFDIVLCMGPLYHLTEEADRQQCLKECKRVLRKGGILITAYINRFCVIPYVITHDYKYLNENLIKSISNTGVLRNDDPLCFWTDTYYATPDNMENDYTQLDLKIIDHLAADGISLFLSDSINRMNSEQFDIWCEYHYSTCREKSIMGISNHGLIIGKN